MPDEAKNNKFMKEPQQCASCLFRSAGMCRGLCTTYRSFRVYYSSYRNQSFPRGETVWTSPTSPAYVSFSRGSTTTETGIESAAAKCVCYRAMMLCVNTACIMAASTRSSSVFEVLSRTSFLPSWHERAWRYANLIGHEDVDKSAHTHATAQNWQLTAATNAEDHRNICKRFSIQQHTCVYHKCYRNDVDLSLFSVIPVNISLLTHLRPLAAPVHSEQHCPALQ